MCVIMLVAVGGAHRQCGKLLVENGMHLCALHSIKLQDVFSTRVLCIALLPIHLCVASSYEISEETSFVLLLHSPPPPRNIDKICHLE